MLVAIAAPIILCRISDHASPNRVEIDIGQEIDEGRVVFHDHALETIFPEEPATVVGFVVCSTG